MRKAILILLLVLSFLPLAYIVFIVTQFHWAASQDWLYSDAFRYAKTACILGLIACYVYLVKSHQYLSRSSKQNWYIALFVASPIAMPLYWFKHAWPSANKSLNSTPQSGAN